MHYDAEVLINRPVDEVFEFFMDLDNFPRWSTISEARLLTSDGPRVGARLLEVFPIGPWRYELVSEITAYRPPALVAFRSIGHGRVSWEGTARFTAEPPAATRLRVYGDVRLRGALGLLHPLLRRELQHNEAAEMERLQAVLEGSVSPALA